MKQASRLLIFFLQKLSIYDVTIWYITINLKPQKESCMKKKKTTAAPKKKATPKKVKKTTVKKTAAKKTVAKKKVVAKKTTAKKAGAKKAAVKKTTAKKTVAKKTVAKKTVAKKPAAKKPSKPKKVTKVMEEFKEHELHSGKKGPVVTSKKQAVAIALSEARKAGEDVTPPKKKKSRK